MHKLEQIRIIAVIKCFQLLFKDQIIIETKQNDDAVNINDHVISI